MTEEKQKKKIFKAKKILDKYQQSHPVVVGWWVNFLRNDDFKGFNGTRNISIVANKFSSFVSLIFHLTDFYDPRISDKNVILISMHQQSVGSQKQNTETA